MSSIYISALSLSLMGCSTVTVSGTEEAVLFSEKDVNTEQAQAALQPHHDLPMSIEFSCPKRLATMMTFYVIPFPPILPVGFVNHDVSYLRITVPPDAEYAIARTRIITPQGTAIALSDLPEPRRITNGENLELTYTLKNKCEAFDRGHLEVADFSYKNRHYSASSASLQFNSKIKHAFAWSANGIFNGGQAVTGGFDAMRTPEQ